LHPSRSNHHCLYQQKFRSIMVCLILKSLYSAHCNKVTDVHGDKKSKSLHWKSPACIKERLLTSAHTSQSPTEYYLYGKMPRCRAPIYLI
jgi:hypothetical protein